MKLILVVFLALFFLIPRVASTVISAHPDPRNASRMAGVEYDMSNKERVALDEVLKKLNEHKLAKTTSDPRKRVLFVAGLEGSGHGMFSAMAEKCSLCSYDDNIRRLLFNFTKTDYNGLYGTDSYITHGSSVIEVYERMREIATSSSNEGLILLNASEDDHTGQLSYPNFEGPLRNLHNPDVHALAAIAEAAGVDFRMLVLQRPAEEMFKSFQRRWARKEGLTLMSMSNSAATLFAQLQQLDSSFYTCVPYQDFKASFSGEAGRKLGDFLHPSFYGKDGGKSWENMLGVIKPRSPPSGNSEQQTEAGSKQSATAIRYHLHRLKGRLGMIEDLCKAGKNNQVE